MAMQYDLITVRADGLDGKKALQYEATVLAMLRSFERTQTGRSILQAFRFMKRELLVFPYDGSGGPCNAVGGFGSGGMFRTKLSFTPSDFYGKSACFPPQSPGGLAHEVLYHELVHAVRHAAGTLDYSIKNRAREEEIAVMVANVYQSEIGRKLRRPGGGTDTMTISSQEFFAKNGDMIRVFYHQHPEFCRWIAEAVVPFNPLRTYYLTLSGVARLRSA